MYILFHSLSSSYLTGHHECEVLCGGPEAAESGARWRECKKNPGHEEFISVKDFKENYLPRVQSEKQRAKLKTAIDLTVRIRIHWTSPARPDGYPLSGGRGTKTPRMGTGFIVHVYRPVSTKPCPCFECNGEITRKFWRLEVRTAHHVVYNTEEAKSTRVDLFYDHDSCERDGRMKTLKGLAVVMIYPKKDICDITCVTHNEALVERIQSARSSLLDKYTCWEPLDLSGLDFLPSCDKGHCPILIASHPHGQPKKITVGQARNGERFLVEYNAATCPGSSGAPVFGFYTDPGGWSYYLVMQPVHCGSSTSASTHHRNQLILLTRYLQERKEQETKQEQLNYGYLWW